jgi:hypothetical protein
VSSSLTAALERTERTEDPCGSDLLWDVPEASAALCSIYRIEQGYAEFCRLLLDGFLTPHWDQERTGQVEEISLPKEEKDKSKEQKPCEPSFVQLAEELIVIRYVALIRAVLINIRSDTTINELGWEFYLRIATFGAVPVLTWLAYQFPEIGGSLYKIIQPGLQVVK